MSSPDPVPGLREHVSSPECWCKPVEVEPGLWLHNRIEGIDLHLDTYVPDLKGAIEGDEAL